MTAPRDIAPWAQTASGRAVDLLTPTPEQITLSDIALSLSRIPRFGGQIVEGRTWSVADHSQLVCGLMPSNAPVDLRFAALLHDAHEAYIGDITTPVEVAIALLLKPKTYGMDVDPIGELKQCLQAVIHRAFSLPWPLSDEWATEIKAADVKALAVEKMQLLAPEPKPWAPLPDVGDPAPLAQYTQQQSQDLFVWRVFDLIRQRHGCSAVHIEPRPDRHFHPEPEAV